MSLSWYIVVVRRSQFVSHTLQSSPFQNWRHDRVYNIYPSSAFSNFDFHDQNISERTRNLRRFHNTAAAANSEKMWPYNPNLLGEALALPPLPVYRDVPHHLLHPKQDPDIRSKPSDYSDIVFVSVDFENLEGIRSHAHCTGLYRRGHAQVGVSILDTRSLRLDSPTESNKDL